MATIDWNRFFARYELAAIGCAHSLTGDPEAGRQVYDTASQLMWARARASEISFESGAAARDYLFRLLRTLADDTTRRSLAPHADQVPLPPAAENTRIDLQQRDERIREAIAGLRPTEREAMQLRYQAGVDLHAMADRTKTSVATLHSRIEAGLEKIRRAIMPRALPGR